MNDTLRQGILTQAERFDLETQCSRVSIDVSGADSPVFVTQAQFPLVAYLQSQDATLCTPESVNCLCSFRKLYDLFSQSCASRVEGCVGDAKVRIYRDRKGVHIQYKF